MFLAGSNSDGFGRSPHFIGGSAFLRSGGVFARDLTEQELASLNFKARAKGFTLVPITEPS
jgi:hypothetical protein